jgi:outer membrane protein assembly factor BamB
MYRWGLCGLVSLGLATMAFAGEPSSRKTALPEAARFWPQFRGPHGNGHADARGLPLRWSESENVAWKTAIHDLGWSSPVIWENQVWVTTGSKDGKQLFAVCVERDSGKVVHDVKVFDVARPEKIAPSNSYASPTAAIEAGRVYVHYGTYGTACLNTSSGEVLWTRSDLTCDHHEGPGSSPILFGDLLIFNVDGCDVQYVVALDKKTGKTAWKTNRSIDYTKVHKFCRKGFCTPAIFELDGRAHLVSPGSKAVMSYDPATGEELWKVRYRGWSVTPQPAYGNGLVYFVMDHDRPELWAVRPNGRGDLTDAHIAWKITEAVGPRTSPLLIGDLLYILKDTLTCVEAKTGQTVWRERPKGSYSASPLYADGRIHLFSENAVATLIEPGRQFKVIATNTLDGALMATPAAVGHALFIRTQTHLYRIENPR